MSFEQALAELETVVERLEGGEVPLEESIALYERGEALRKHCEKRLADAELKVQRIVAGADGEAAATRISTPDEPGDVQTNPEEPRVSQRPDTPLLDLVDTPADMRGFSDDQLVRLAHELRAETISAVSETGGHLGAGLGVVELTVGSTPSSTRRATS